MKRQTMTFSETIAGGSSKTIPVKLPIGTLKYTVAFDSDNTPNANTKIAKRIQLQHIEYVIDVPGTSAVAASTASGEDDLNIQLTANSSLTTIFNVYLNVLISSQ